MSLAFGYNDGLVDGVTCAWGARWIVTQDGGVDHLHDRQDIFGSDVAVGALTEWLNRPLGDGWGEDAKSSPFLRARKNLSRFLIESTVSTRTARPVILHQDREGAVIGNTNGSGGYFYVTAYRFADLPDGHPTRGLERVLGATQ